MTEWGESLGLSETLTAAARAPACRGRYYFRDGTVQVTILTGRHTPGEGESVIESQFPRRTFLAGSVLSAAALAAPQQLAAAEQTPGQKPEVYELRIYEMKEDAMRQRADAYFGNALLPALGRAGIGSVGAFVELKTPEKSPVYLLIPHPSMDSVAALPQTLLNDQAHQTAGAAFLAASPKEPGYQNLEVRLMIALDFMPRLQVPAKSDTRIFELRRYRNPTDAAYLKKVEMFGQAGELTIFHRAGLTPVFFSGTMAGPDMPNITYMLAYPDADAHGKVWKSFGSDPDWKKLSTTPGYTNAEIIADIKSTMLKPTAYSQI
jgi:hypothetical protein